MRRAARRHRAPYASHRLTPAAPCPRTPAPAPCLARARSLPAASMRPRARPRARAPRAATPAAPCAARCRAASRQPPVHERAHALHAAVPLAAAGLVTSPGRRRSRRRTCTVCEQRHRLCCLDAGARAKLDVGHSNRPRARPAPGRRPRRTHHSATRKRGRTPLRLAAPLAGRHHLPRPLHHLTRPIKRGSSRSSRPPQPSLPPLAPSPCLQRCRHGHSRPPPPAIVARPP